MIELPVVLIIVLCILLGGFAGAWLQARAALARMEATQALADRLARLERVVDGAVTELDRLSPPRDGRVAPPAA